MPFPKLLAVCLGFVAGLLLNCSLSSAYTYRQNQGKETVQNISTATMLPLQEKILWLLNNTSSLPLPFSIQQGGYQHTTSGLHNLLYTFYQENNFLPYWVTRYGPISKAHILLFVLLRVDKEGLDPKRYQVDKITALLMSRKTEDLAQLDLMLTLALYLYVGDMQEGAVTSCLLDPALFASARSTFVYRPALLRKAVQAPDLQLFLQSLSPRHYQYQALKKMLASYRALAQQGGWPKIPPGQTLRQGMTDPRLKVLAERLFLSGDLKDFKDFTVIPPPPLLAFPKPFPRPLSSDSAQPSLPPAWRVAPSESRSPSPVYHLHYSDSLLRAVKHFQQRYNLKQDGIVGTNTLRKLNQPIEEHIRQIILNMERWGWFPHQFKGRRIIVNIAGFHLIGMKDSQVEITMPVIVGKVKKKTPVFNHFMTYIEVNPYWNIPPSIARDEIVAKVIRNPFYLQEQGIRIFSSWQEGAYEISPQSIDWNSIGHGISRFHLRQEPGPYNALGTIKFMFPNDKNIYLHDTPSQSLFWRAQRALSHGCVRLSRPLDLASYILNNDHQMISQRQLKQQIARRERKVFALHQPLPVHLLYRTVWVDPATGTASFYDDIYGRDALLEKALFPRHKVKCSYSY
ncbi:MAG: hypothetical protein D3911_02505 [Candidatus Electrothrix sp. AW3_4]|nr:hypothetical protein [Candidatus Electrothrix gigas]